MFRAAAFQPLGRQESGSNVRFQRVVGRNVRGQHGTDYNGQQEQGQHSRQLEPPQESERLRQPGVPQHVYPSSLIRGSITPTSKSTRRFTTTIHRASRNTAACTTGKSELRIAVT